MDTGTGTADAFARFARGGTLSRLTRLKVDECVKLPSGCGTCLPALAAMDIVSIHGPIDWPSLAACSTVTSLKARFYSRILWGNDVIAWPGFKQLRRLHYGIVPIPACGLLGLSALTQLVLEDGGRLPSSISSLAALCELQIDSAKDLDLQALAALSQLTKLTVSGQWPIVGAFGWDALSGLRQLRELSISADPGVRMPVLAPAVQELQRLELQWMELEGVRIRLL